MFAYAPARTALVVGPISTADERDRLRKFGIDVAVQVGAQVTVALHTDHAVSDYEAVYTLGSRVELRDSEGLVLVAEALAAGMEVEDTPDPKDCGTCDCGRLVTVHPRWNREGELVCTECSGWAPECAHCASDHSDFEPLEIVPIDDTFYPVHPACLAEARQMYAGCEFATV
ncbi:hypothetical protein K388_00316 [Streptomyces sp. KhCrAH-43]|uniref:hypothetical protein n=1 Tax=unclassified Streptomyces TaxID=2593676 RepID=UPI0003729E9A|nr:MULTISPECIES: hypothetical protein [unclassified Streptomyces]MYS37906.1 hypothetical protein [Streptomyces sp. SID4920]MYX66093.1 hypothetical protein [Streptomyces sp. SID8373]RAJ67576.1 hypothetical protein K388_00316 [Streptomyces sp. KhCrAH-43]